MTDDPVQQARASLELGRRTIHFCAKRLKDTTVLDAGGTRTFAGATIKAMIEMALDVVVERNLTFVNTTHEMNAAARTIHLSAEFQIGWACGRAESAVNAVQK